MSVAEKESEPNYEQVPYHEVVLSPHKTNENVIMSQVHSPCKSAPRDDSSNENMINTVAVPK